jgi:hypothetical protein
VTCDCDSDCIFESFLPNSSLELAEHIDILDEEAAGGGVNL